jgi:ubiquitin C-terminal hydrolase
MNACLQCLLPIEELRNHFLQQEYLSYKKRGVDRKRNNFDFCDKFNQFYSMVFTKSSKDKKWVLNPELSYRTSRLLSLKRSLMGLIRRRLSSRCAKTTID